MTLFGELQNSRFAKRIVTFRNEFSDLAFGYFIKTLKAKISEAKARQSKFLRSEVYIFLMYQEAK